MKVRVEANGSVAGTRVLLEDGTDISEWIAGASFQHRAGGVPEIRLDLLMVSATIEGPAVVYGVGGKEVRSIEYADGSVDRFGETVSITPLGRRSGKSTIDGHDD